VAARIILVHDERELAEASLTEFRQAGYDVVALDSLAAIDKLGSSEHFDLVITRARLPEGTPNGAALARMARHKQPGIKVQFVSYPDVREHIEDLGEILERPLTPGSLIAAVEEVLSPRTPAGWC
jgi:DNA-binding response OmpR family regulator